MLEKLVSEISHQEAKSLYHKTITIKENESKLCFEAFVVDICFDDQKGVIVRVLKKDVLPILERHRFGEADHESKKYLEIDLRDIHSGRFFSIVKGLEDSVVQ